VADVLEQLPTRSVTEAVMQVARKGTPAGRVNALRVLGTSPDRAAAGACLVEAFRTQEGEVRLEAVRSLARLGGPEHEGVLVEALGEVDHDVLSAVLTALAESGTAAGREQVRNLAGAPAQANTLVKEILAYERAIAASLGPEDFEALVRLAGSPGAVKDDRRLILDTVAELHPQLDAKLRKLFDPLLAEVDEDLHLSAQLCLARLGDRNERRDVLKRFDELVARNEEWAGAYEQRGAVLLKLGDYGEAAKDYAHAIKVYKDINRSDVAETLYVDLARAHVLDQNLKKAHEALIEGGVSRAVLKQLAQDPDFRPLVEHGRYGRIFD
jgi:tetratricopeptide (TPR) repeat protein